MLDDQQLLWERFTDAFGFRPGGREPTRPVIVEPAPSITVDLSVPDDRVGVWRSRVDAVNAEALRCFVAEFAEDPMWVVLVWQDFCYRLDAAVHAATRHPDWRVPVHPQGATRFFCVRTSVTASSGIRGSRVCVCSVNVSSVRWAEPWRRGCRSFDSMVAQRDLCSCPGEKFSARQGWCGSTRVVVRHLRLGGVSAGTMSVVVG
ncbi:DUF2716 domain-containing protein [Rhodococcus rhodochrous]|uniref:DUF2716 domain-containing protein n=1 Tax=Rhodococcus rhodochrous TaxID=1829 RepID=UPI003FD7E88F